ncbi:hypothetical protein [Aureimonas sp. ME7]|uniref:hypothetical protein n=1 Tax=Aureimonas sp. ME7 TaxID=2744252 RepID=UPI0015F979AF|nr:hypothetical protein [Aureimonas sp. ME7]
MAEARKAGQELLIAAIQAGRWIDDDRLEVHDDRGSIIGCIELMDLLPTRSNLSAALDGD